MYICNETMTDMMIHSVKIGRRINPTSLHALFHLSKFFPSEEHSVDKVCDAGSHFISIFLVYSPNTARKWVLREISPKGTSTRYFDDINELKDQWQSTQKNYRWHNTFRHPLANTDMAKLEFGWISKEGDRYVAWVDNPKGKGASVKFCNLTLNSVIDLFEMYA